MGRNKILPKYESDLVSHGIKTVRYYYTNYGRCPECGYYYPDRGYLLGFTCEKCGKDIPYYLILPK